MASWFAFSFWPHEKFKRVNLKFQSEGKITTECYEDLHQACSTQNIKKAAFSEYFSTSRRPTQLLADFGYRIKRGRHFWHTFGNNVHTFLVQTGICPFRFRNKYEDFFGGWSLIPKARQILLVGQILFQIAADGLFGGGKKSTVFATTFWTIYATFFKVLADRVLCWPDVFVLTIILKLATQIFAHWRSLTLLY